MVTIAEVCDTLKTVGVNNLIDDYNQRQQMIINGNNAIIADFLNELGFDYSPFKGETVVDTFRNIINFSKSNAALACRVNELLEKYNYKAAIELTMLITSYDGIMHNDYPMWLFESSIPAYTSIYAASKNNDTLVANSNKGTIILNPANKALNEEEYSNRISHCHHVVSDALHKHENYYGAYYYIPMDFAGCYEHSVMINYDDKVVYDLANNTAISLDIFEAFVGKPEFVIKGTYFNLLDKQVQDKCGHYLYMHHLEEVRRTRKKSGGR